MKKKLLWLLLVLTGMTVRAQGVLSLDSCRALALRNNRQIAIAKAEIDKAGWNEKAAHTNYFPKVGLTAGYVRSGDEVSLLTDGQKSVLANIGTYGVTQFSAIAQQMVAQNPDLASLVQTFSSYMPQLGQAGNAMGQNLVDALRTDTRNMTAGAIFLTQPLYMGGKIKAYERITKYQRELAGEGLRAGQLELLLDVDKAYWQVVSLANKRVLAMKYRDMLAHLDSDMVKMVSEGVATKSNGLAVSVKLNEAEMSLMKVEDGLTLSRMLLCQLCGLPLNSGPVLADEKDVDIPAQSDDIAPDVQTAYANRPELRQLQAAVNIYNEKVNVERAAFLPQLALTGGYLISNPNCFNSFEKKFRGTWAVGVLLKVPVWNWGEGKYKIRAAKADALTASLRNDEARERIGLQVSQEAFRVNEANRKLELSIHNLLKAGENLRTAQLGHQEGVISTSDLLQAQTAWLQAHSDKIDAQIDTRITRAAYNKAIGL